MKLKNPEWKFSFISVNCKKKMLTILEKSQNFRNHITGNKNTVPDGETK